MPTKLEDIRECTLNACHTVGLYPTLDDPNGDDFLDREARELVEASEDTCPVAPPYNLVLMTFREDLRSCLRGKGYTDITLFLQRLCSVKDPGGKPFTWRDFCRFHVLQVQR